MKIQEPLHEPNAEVEKITPYNWLTQWMESSDKDTCAVCLDPHTAPGNLMLDSENDSRTKKWTLGTSGQSMETQQQQFNRTSCRNSSSSWTLRKRCTISITQSTKRRQRNATRARRLRSKRRSTRSSLHARQLLGQKTLQAVQGSHNQSLTKARKRTTSSSVKLSMAAFSVSTRLRMSTSIESFTSRTEQIQKPGFAV